MADNTLGKEDLLAAIAAAGSQGKNAFDQAQQVLAQQQQNAVRATQGLYAGSSPEAAAQLNQIMSQPYANRNLGMALNSQANQDWFNRLSANAGDFWSKQQGLIPAIERQYQLEQALKVAESQASAASKKAAKGPSGPDWANNLKDAFSTLDVAKKSIGAESSATNDPHVSGMPNYLAAQKNAIENYGVPDNVAAAWFPQSSDESKFESTAMAQANAVKNRHQLRKFVKNVRQYGNQNPNVPNRGYYQRQAIIAAQQRAAAQRQAQARQRQQRRNAR